MASTRATLSSSEQNMSPHLPSTVRFLERLGFEFHLDWNDELEIHSPEITAADIVSELEKYEDDVTGQILRRAASNLEQFVGGPFNGQRHDAIYWGQNQFIGRKVSRAKWAVYELQKDGRAFFRGWAKSKVKMLRGEIYEKDSAK